MPAGTPAAPIGTTTIAFMNVCNAAGLLTELPTAARQAVATFQVGQVVVAQFHLHLKCKQKDMSVNLPLCKGC
jgi:hypothetical protein